MHRLAFNLGGRMTTNEKPAPDPVSDLPAKPASDQEAEAVKGGAEYQPVATNLRPITRSDSPRAIIPCV